MILRRLTELGSSDIGLWCSYFSNRKVTISGNTQSLKRGVSRGCPQGSICGPIIWNYVMDTLLSNLYNQGISCIAYADDLLMLTEADNRTLLERSGTLGMRVVDDWAASVGLVVSRSKSGCIFLKGILSTTRPPWIKTMRSGLAIPRTRAGNTQCLACKSIHEELIQWRGFDRRSGLTLRRLVAQNWYYGSQRGFTPRRPVALDS